MAAPATGTVCFTMSVTDELELVHDRVARLERVFPGCRIVLLPDGEAASSLGWPSAPPTVVLRPSRERLYAAGNGGLVVRRHLEAFLESDAACWFKVDPDTVPWRPLRELPAAVCFFGTIQGGPPGPSLQGGCIGGTRAAAIRLLASGALTSPELLRPEQSWAAGNPNLIARLAAGRVSFDFVHAWACRSAGIPLVDHPDIRSEWRQPPAEPSRFAITHPHKALDVAAEQRAARARRRSVAQFVEQIDGELPVSATVAVVSKGDPEFVAPGRRRRMHFPADASGAWAGFHPADSEQAIAMLEAARAAGVDHLALPTSADWWLDHYAGLARHLADHHRLLVHGGAGRIWALEEDAS